MASAARSQPEGTHRLIIPLATKPPRLTEHRIARDLESLCDMGLIEAFRDDNNIVRYRPTNGRTA